MKVLLIVCVLALMACTEHNPNNVLNPESAAYVGDSAANVDANGNNIADVLEPKSDCAVAGGECHSSITLSSGIELSSTLSSSAESSSSPQSSAGGSSELQISAGSSFLASSSSTGSSSGAAYMLTVTGGTIAGGVSGSYFAKSKLLSVSFDNASLGLNVCFAGWNSSAVLDGVDLSLPNLQFRMPAADLQLTGTTEACAGKYTDIRDGKVYDVLDVGVQKWMSKNLEYAVDSSWCYASDAANCETYGRLYTAEAAQSICPTSWRLPTVSELMTAAPSLNLQKGGNRVVATTFEQVNGMGFFWTAGPFDDAVITPRVGNQCETNSVACSVAVIVSGSTYGQRSQGFHGFSVRCIYDN